MGILKKVGILCMVVPTNSVLNIPVGSVVLLAIEKAKGFALDVHIKLLWHFSRKMRHLRVHSMLCNY